jgi:cell division protein FtsA
MIGGARCIAGLDVGTIRTRAVLVEIPAPWGGDEESTRILGVGDVATEGVRNRTVTNLDAATASIRDALREAEEMAGIEVQSVYAGIAGDHVDVHRSSGVVAVPGREIGPEDLESVHEVARAVVLPPDRELLHAIPQDYVVDGVPGVQDPTGMEATRLEAEFCAVTAATTPCQNLRKVVDRAGYRVDELVLTPLATNLAVLDPERRRAGVVLMEVGAAATEVLVFSDERLRLVATLPWGGATVTSDIVKGLGVPAAEAERLKARHGSAQARAVDAEETLDIPGPTPGGRREVSRELLAHIIEQRLDEIFGLVYEELDDKGLIDSLPAGVVLTGGGAALDGAADLAQEVFNLPVSLGTPGAGLAGVVEAVRRPDLAAAVGLSLYGRHRRSDRGGGSAVRALARVTGWLKDFF